MSKYQLELLNIAADLKRSVYYYVEAKNPKYSDCEMLQNVVKNKNKFDFINYDLIKNNDIPPLEKAEYLLMYSNQLQHFLGF